jgi:hypothetical protein
MAIGFNSIRASDSWCRCRKRNYAVSIERLFDAVERRGDIGRRVAALILPISNRPRVTSSCAGKIGLREPGEHTSGPNLASRDNVAHNQNLYTILEAPPRLTRFIESRLGYTTESRYDVATRPLGIAASYCEAGARRQRVDLRFFRPFRVDLSIRKSSSFLPFFSCSTIQRGFTLRPTQVSPKGTRYFGGTFLPINALAFCRHARPL